MQRWFNVFGRCKLQIWNTQLCFNVDLTLSHVATLLQSKDNVRTTLKCLLGKSYLFDYSVECILVTGTIKYRQITVSQIYRTISEPTHIQRNSSSCTGLIFTDQPSLVTNNGVHASLHSTCHHQIKHCTFNLNIALTIYINP